MNRSSNLVSTTAMLALLMMLQIVMQNSIPTAHAFTPSLRTSIASIRTTTSQLAAINKKNSKFNKQKDLAAKMAEAKRQRELELAGDGDDDTAAQPTTASSSKEEEERELTPKEIKLRNDRQRFADMLDNSMSSGGSGSDLDKGYYLTVEQENENADAVFKGIVRLYEGDPAPTSPFTELLNIENGEPLGKGGMKRLLPWEGSQSTASSDYIIVITDPRPKSLELRTAMKRLVGSLDSGVLKKCVVINTDTPAENRRFRKKNLGGESGVIADDSLRIFCDENMEWMREYTALGEKRFSMTMFVLRNGKVEKIAREVEAEVLTMVLKNAIKSLYN
ncbi:hypothetical protein ACHAXR_002807 [Thalassiosira sp. AJA248-18]